VISAWCLGILNSHRRFLISYSAPIVWNLTIVVALVGWGPHTAPFDLAVVAAWASVAGSALQLLVQLPVALRLVGTLRLFIDVTSVHVRTVVRNFGPVFLGRGVVQISAYVDTVIASFLPMGAVAALTNAQTLYVLPISLFGTSVSAAELPAMSSARGDEDEVAAHLRARLDAGLKRIAFLVVPSAMAFLAIGDVIAAALFQAGRFTRTDSEYVWGILAGSSVGLVASTLGRLYASTYYALRDTRTPLAIALLRVLLTTVLGLAFALPLPPLLGLDPKWGAAGLTTSAGLAGWVEFALLRRGLARRIGTGGMPLGYIVRLWGAAAVAAAAGVAVKLATRGAAPIPVGVLAIGAYGTAYFVTAAALGLREARLVLVRVPGLGRWLG